MLLKKVFNGVIKAIDEKESTLTASISTNAVDRMREVVDPSGADMSNYKKNPVVLWAHDYSVPPIGKSLWVKRDGNSLISKVKFASTEFAQEIFQLYKEGFMSAFSIGFIPKETQEATEKDAKDPKKARRTFTKWELLEFSAVPVPANPEALSMAMQKGILTSEIKDQIEAAAEGWQEDPEEEPEIEPEEKIETPTTIITINPDLESLQKDNEDLLSKIESLERENTELRFKLYEKLNQKKSSEITVDTLADTIVRAVDGVIRTAKGRTN